MEYVYKAIGEDGDILYVGITNNIHSRTSQHKANSLWFPLHVRLLVAEFPNRTVSKMYETFIINKYSPVYNKSENKADEMDIVSFDEDVIKWEDYQNYPKITNTLDKKRDKPSKESKHKVKYSESLSYKKDNKESLEHLKRYVDYLEDAYYDRYGNLCLRYKFLSYDHANSCGGSGIGWLRTNNVNITSSKTTSIDGTVVYEYNFKYFNHNTYTKDLYEELYEVLRLDRYSLNREKSLKQEEDRVNSLRDILDKIMVKTSNQFIINNKLESIPLNSGTEVINEGRGYYSLFHDNRLTFIIIYDPETVIKKPKGVKVFNLINENEFNYLWYILLKLKVKYGYEKGYSVPLESREGWDISLQDLTFWLKSLKLLTNKE